MSVKVGINGFGRIGRVLFRAAMNNPEIDIVAINDLMDTKTLSHLLKYDSVHGNLDNNISHTENSILVDDQEIFVTSQRNPSLIPWAKYGVDIAAECTGIFRDRAGAGKHLEAGAKKVIISAPASDPDITIVCGVNDMDYNPEQHHIISNASCTTNCLAPVLKVLLANYGIESGLMTTIHAYTGDQRLLDFPHKDLRRARAAGLSMIPTTTGAAKAVALVLPELEGKLNGLSVRVPTPNVSLVDVVVQITKEGVSVQDVNQVLKEASEGELKGILGYTDLPLVSTDFNGSPLSSIVDSSTTDVKNRLIKVLSWYDNETGYSNRMVDLMLKAASYF
ncbi:MAG: type I glyceraldehyde-3-phosphate dehydrogenase [Deltaproteobacteria bacterium]|nr:MAG: type I glyceraldehyde-3-phosphate dehydrogenase [Deltaproteobacteria bacterium]